MQISHPLPSSNSLAWPIDVALALVIMFAGKRIWKGSAAAALWADPRLFLALVLAVLLFAGYVRLVVRITRAFLFALLAIAIVGTCFALIVVGSPHGGGDAAVLGPFFGLALLIFAIAPFVLLVSFVAVLVRDGKRYGKAMLERTAEPVRTRIVPSFLLIWAVRLVLFAR